jgi:glutamate racemase
MRSFRNKPIGVFDSGVGGLTVLRELNKYLPQESILYFADTERLPYGNRSAQEIIQFVREILLWMERHEAKMVIMACNTSSALALEAVRQEVNFPVLGIIFPGALGAVQKGKRIGVISTLATANSNAYLNAIQEIDRSAKVWQVGCPEFVPIIEGNRIKEPESKKIIFNYLAPLLKNKIDTLIYGCTHYPHLEPVIREIVPPTVRLIDPAKYLRAATEKELELLGLKCSLKIPPVSTKFYVSGCPQSFARASRQWLGYLPKVQKAHLNSVSVALESIE